MDTSGHDWPSCGMEHAAGVLVEVLEIDGFEAEVGSDRGRYGLSRARNRICLGGKITVRFATERHGGCPGDNVRAIGGANMMFMTMATRCAATCCWRWWWPGSRSGGGHSGSGRARRRAGRPGGGQAMADFVRKISHPTDACRARSALSGIAVEMVRSSSSHPLCPCGRRRHCSRGVPLVSRTSVPPLRRSPVSVSRGLLRIVASRWVTCGLPDRFSPVSAGGSLIAATDGSSPLFEMAGRHSMQGCRPECSSRS